MIFPYRVKNPPKRFPYATLSLIALNLLIYGLTTRWFVFLDAKVFENYCLRWEVNPFTTMFAGLFLHVDVFHILGNMLYLWVFGPAVEDRMGVGLYLLLYFVAGLAGDLAQGAFAASSMHGVTPMLGASGCIMGVLGAYLYMYPWSRVCLFGLFILYVGTFEAAAIWVIGAFVALDLANGLLGRLFGVSGGVANFAHVGGAVIGGLLAWGLGTRRDSEEVSRVKAAHAEAEQFGYLDFDEMEKLIADAPGDKALIADYARKATVERDFERMRTAMDLDLRLCITNHPLAIADYLYDGGKPPVGLTAADLLYLGSECERLDKPHVALAMYGMADARSPQSADAEMALFRSASLMWRQTRDGVGASEKLSALLARFPRSLHALEAEDMLSVIARSRAA